MSWYLCKLVYRIHCGNGQHTPQFDEQLRLISADHPREALQKAKILGKKEEQAFFNHDQQMVSWQFVDTSELHPLEALLDGAELYSRIEEKDHAEGYEDIIRRKALALAREIAEPQLKLA